MIQEKRESGLCRQVEEVPVPEALEVGAAVPEVEAVPEDIAVHRIAVVIHHIEVHQADIAHERISQQECLRISCQKQLP